MTWTDERVELLTKLWGDGLSASQIAAQLGGVSRNAVIGKVHRLKLSRRGTTPATAPRAKKAATATTTTAAAAPAPTPAPATPRVSMSTGAAASPVRSTVIKSVGATALKIEEEVEIEDVVADLRPTGDVVIPISRHLTLMQLTERTCKWPNGDPMHDDFHFCGHEAEEATPYCAYHSKLAFQPTSERRRAR